MGRFSVKFRLKTDSHIIPCCATLRGHILVDPSDCSSSRSWPLSSETARGQEEASVLISSRGCRDIRRTFGVCRARCHPKRSCQVLSHPAGAYLHLKALNSPDGVPDTMARPWWPPDAVPCPPLARLILSLQTGRGQKRFRY